MLYCIDFFTSSYVNKYKIINQYHTTYILYSGLNHVNYLNIIKSDHVSATVQLRGSPNTSGLQAHNRFFIIFHQYFPLFKSEFNSFLHALQNSSVDVHKQDILPVLLFQLRYVHNYDIPILSLHFFQILVKSRYS